ncbi:MAG: DNA-binding protein [Nitrosopumilaceae archaeon]|jgi:DNA-binding protein
MSNSTRDTIFIGKKPLMTYVTSAIIQLSTMPIVTLKARGYSIAMAVDVAQVIQRKTNAFEIGKIKIDHEVLESTDGKKRNVSTIEIPMKRTFGKVL